MNRIFLCVLVVMFSNSYAQTSKDWVYDKQREKGTSTKYSARRTPTPEPKREEQSIDELKNILVERYISQPDLELSELACDAEISIEYTQMDDKVQVDTHISNQQCPSSHGRYTIRVRIRDKFGETHTSNHTEIWRLENSSQSVMGLLYDIGSDVELLSTRVHGSAQDFCTCDTQEVENIDAKQAEAQ